MKDEDGNVLRTTYTDDKGQYVFTDLEDGKYQVVFETPEGFEPTQVGSGNASNDSNGLSTWVTVEGEDNFTLDSGFHYPAEKAEESTEETKTTEEKTSEDKTEESKTEESKSSEGKPSKEGTPAKGSTPTAEDKGTPAPSKGEAPASEGEPEEAKKDGILPSTGEEAVQTAGIAAGLAAMGGLFLTLFKRKNKGSDQE